MVWQEKVSCIVMITKLKERNKSKCELYMPEECDHTVDYENINVTIRQISYYPDYEVRKLLVKVSDSLEYMLNLSSYVILFSF